MSVGTTLHMRGDKNGGIITLCLGDGALCKPAEMNLTNSLSADSGERAGGELVVGFEDHRRFVSIAGFRHAFEPFLNIPQVKPNAALAEGGLGRRSQVRRLLETG